MKQDNVFSFGKKRKLQGCAKTNYLAKKKRDEETQKEWNKMREKSAEYWDKQRSKEYKEFSKYLSDRDGNTLPEGVLPDLYLVKRLVETGHDDTFISDFFHLPLDAYYSLVDRFPRFKEALNAWRKPAADNVEKALYQRAVGYTHREAKVLVVDKSVEVVETTKHYPPDSKSCMDFLTNKRPKDWSNKRDVNISADGSLAEMILAARRGNEEEDDFLN